MRFYINYAWHKEDYIVCNANISEISYQYYGKSGAYENEIEYSIDKKNCHANIRTAIGDQIGHQIQIGVKKDDYTQVAINYLLRYLGGLCYIIYQNKSLNNGG